MRRVSLRRLPLTSYAKGLDLQRSLVAQRRAGTVPDTLLLLQHPPVFTLGRLQRDDSQRNLLVSSSEIEAAGASVFRSDRGGNVTFHGPGQLVAYPILDLHNYRKDMRWYVHTLESVLIETAASFGVSARAGGEGETGIWVDDRKLGAIGVHVTRWVTSHGVALNADVNLDFFKMIVPCGLHEKREVTSLSAERARGEVGMEGVGTEEVGVEEVGVGEAGVGEAGVGEAGGGDAGVSVEQAMPAFETAFERQFGCELVR